jgi:transposase
MSEENATPVAEVIADKKLPEPNTMQMIQSRDHPHYGELGWMDKDTLQHATGQYYFKLSNCQHGTAGCYVLESDLTSPDVALQTTENPTNPTIFDPYKHSEDTEAKLIEAFGKSFNITEACQFAGIHRDTYYDWIKQIEGFEARMEEAKAAPLKKAKSVIDTALRAGDVATAKWYVERRDPDFKPKAEVDNTHELKETRKKIGEFLDDDDSTDDVGSQPPTADASTAADEVAATPTDIS